VLRNDHGKVIAQLDKQDISKLLATGWRPPKTVVVKARDGKTDSLGRPSLFLAAALFSEFKDSIRQGPLFDRLVFAALAPIASALGYRRQLDPYLHDIERSGT